MKSIVITGASTGIGYASAQELVEKGYRVFGSVRKAHDAERLRQTLGENFYPLIFDVNDQTAVEAAAREVQQIVGDEGLFGLFNNAGTALTGPLMHQPMEEIEMILQTNVMGIIKSTRAFLPMLGARDDSPHPPGTIINMSSVGGKASMPFIGAYCASKHAVEGLSDALRREMMLYGIKVVILEPGAVVTPIWEKAPPPENTGYQNTAFENSLLAFLKFFAEEGKKGLQPEKVARLVRKIFESKRPKARYMITPTPFTDKVLFRLIPTRIVDNLLAKSMKLSPQNKPEKKLEVVE